MKTFLTTIKYDYLQRTRSYGFLITLCISLAIGYSFVPEPDAGYSTIKIGGYLGVYNSAWIGSVTAIMTSIFLSLIGFYLVNNSIENDQKTKMGQIVAATTISNFKYLLSKTLSNFLVLTTIAFLVFIMSVILFFIYNAGYPFELFQFVKPYILLTVPALFFISVLAIVFEIIFGRFSVLQNIVFFFVITTLMVFRPKNDMQFAMDVFGSKIVIHHMEEAVKTISGKPITQMNIGYTINNSKNSKSFVYEALDFPNTYIMSRGLWLLISLSILGIMTPFFHRFNVRERQSKKRKATLMQSSTNTKTEIELSALPQPKTTFGLFAILKTELLMLIRKGKTWLWLFNLIGMALLIFLPLDIAHQFVLPILWFLQVGRLSDLTSKELAHKVHYFAFASYRPLSRLLLSQLLSASTLMLTLALPLIIRLGIENQISAMVFVILGGVFVVMFTAILGILTKGKKLFEILFFIITYANINGITFLDYFGAASHSNTSTPIIALINALLISFCFWIRQLQLKRL